MSPLKARRRLRAFVVPLGLSAALFVFYWFIQREPVDIAGFGDIREAIFGKNLRWLVFLAFIPLIFFFVRLVDSLVFDLVMSRQRNVVAPQLLREILDILLYFILFAWATAVIFNYSLTGWLATGSVLAVVLGFALQDTLGNLFAGISLHLEDSFEVGDVIRSGDYIGVVEGVRWRGTRIRTFNNNIVILPNSIMARERLEVFPLNNLNARILSVGVDYNVPPATVIDVLTKAAGHVDGVAREMPCFARVGAFGDSSVVYEIKYFTREYSRRDSIDADIRKAVWYALRRNGFSIPFPIRSYQPYKPPEKGVQVTPDELLDRLRGVEILTPLSDAAHESVATAARVHFYGKGETILRSGAAGDSMFVVHGGTVSVRLADDSPQGWHQVAQLGPGSVFGEMALLTGEARTADVAAVTDVVAFEIGKDALQPILSDHPEFASAMADKVASRRETLEAARGSKDDMQHTILSRIRAYFGL